MTAPRPQFCELHLHIEGTLEPATIFDLARRQRLQLPYADEAELAAKYRFTDLQSFLDLYYANMVVLRTEDDFSLLAQAYLDRAAAAGIAHVEMFVDPQAHSERGIAERVVLRGLQRAIDEAAERHGISASIIACVVRDQPVDSAERMLDAVLDSGVPVIGLGLDSAEVGYPPSLFRSVFERAGEAGLHRVAHAGEEGPAEYIWEALDLLGAERIDHGIRALDDPRLVQRLVADRIPLTVCPLSSERLRVVDDLAELPLRQMLDAGLRVTLNSDDPAYFGGYLDDNVEAARRAFSLTADELALLARTSIEASFLSDDRKKELLRAGA
ncbi:adenosine deaminase [Leifsonia poae]|uniref:adenosine deaminase n=1 Tax=Leifsonia poae TaxID=110933 RepID=UPI001CBE922C|nr:adenosine deaminase [Leifsonia poae]